MCITCDNTQHQIKNQEGVVLGVGSSKKGSSGGEGGQGPTAGDGNANRLWILKEEVLASQLFLHGESAAG